MQNANYLNKCLTLFSLPLLKETAMQMWEVTCDWFPIYSSSLTQSTEQSQGQQWQARFTLIYQNKCNLNTKCTCPPQPSYEEMPDTHTHSRYHKPIYNWMQRRADFRFSWKLLSTCSIDSSLTAPCINDYRFDKWLV